MKKFKPDGWPTVTPRIFSKDVPGLIDFLCLVFDAAGKSSPGAPAEVKIGESLIMISDGGGMRERTTAFLYVYVRDAEETYRRAITAGATSIEKPTDTPYGDRRARVRDAWGNTWQIATYQGA